MFSMRGRQVPKRAKLKMNRVQQLSRELLSYLDKEADCAELDALSLPTGARLAYDVGKNPVVLFPNEWSANYFGETNKLVPLSALPVQTARD